MKQDSCRFSSEGRKAIFICSGYYNITVWLKQQIFTSQSSTVLEARKSKVKVSTASIFSKGSSVDL